jgi:hypothetical protein
MAKAKKEAKSATVDLSKLTVAFDNLTDKQRLFIPACGDRLVLAAPWEFTLYFERRNLNFAKALGLIDPESRQWSVYEDPPPGQRYGGSLKRAQVSLPAGLVLECDRVYIRAFSKSALKDDKDYDSITWKVVKNGKTAQKLRFWAKLSQCLDIRYELQHDSLYRDRVKLIKSVQEA